MRRNLLKKQFDHIMKNAKKGHIRFDNSLTFITVEDIVMLSRVDLIPIVSTEKRMTEILEKVL